MGNVCHNINQVIHVCNCLIEIHSTLLNDMATSIITTVIKLSPVYVHNIHTTHIYVAKYEKKSYVTNEHLSIPD